MCRSIYSDISKRSNSIPRINDNCLVTSVLPTPVGPANKNEPIGFSSLPIPDRDILIAVDKVLIASSCPNTTNFKSRSKFFNTVVSSELTCLGGMRAILDTTSSICLTEIVFFRADLGLMFIFAPASSITSMALSGIKRSLMYLSASSAAVLSALSEYLTSWCSSKRLRSPLRI